MDFCSFNFTAQSKTMMLFVLLPTLLIPALAKPIYYGVDLDKLENLTHQHFQSHEIGWSGIGKQGLTRVYLAPNEEAAALWIQKMKKRHYKSSFVEVQDHADLTLWDEEGVIISQFGLLLILVQGEQPEKRKEALQALFIEEEAVVSPTPTILLTEEHYQIKLDDGWEYSFIGGTPVYTPNLIAFTQLPDTITAWNKFAQSHRFQLQKQATNQGVLLFYEYLPNEIPIRNKKDGETTEKIK